MKGFRGEFYTAMCNHCNQKLYRTVCGNIVDWLHENGKGGCK